MMMITVVHAIEKQTACMMNRIFTSCLYFAFAGESKLMRLNEIKRINVAQLSQKFNNFYQNWERFELK